MRSGECDETSVSSVNLLHGGPGCNDAVGGAEGKVMQILEDISRLANNAKFSVSRYKEYGAITVILNLTHDHCG